MAGVGGPCAGSCSHPGLPLPVYLWQSQGNPLGLWKQWDGRGWHPNKSSVFHPLWSWRQGPSSRDPDGSVLGRASLASPTGRRRELDSPPQPRLLQGACQSPDPGYAGCSLPGGHSVLLAPCGGRGRLSFSQGRRRRTRCERLLIFPTFWPLLLKRKTNSVMNFFTKQTHGGRKQTHGYRRGEGVGKG